MKRLSREIAGRELLVGAVFCVWLCAACGSPEKNPTGDAGGDGQPACPAKATTCPPSCYAIGGFKIDSVKHCVGSPEVLACWDGTGGMNAQYGCIVDRDTNDHYLVGSTTYIPDLVATGEWLACGVSATQPCAADGGS